MAPDAGDQFTISIGGDATGPVVAGHGNHVAANRSEPQPQPEPEPEPAEHHPDQRPAPPQPVEPAPAGSTQHNTAHDGATVYTVMNGELHVHAESPRHPDGA